MLNKTLQIFTLLSLLIFSCKKDKSDFQTLDFNVSLVENGYQANWTSTDLGNFEFYRIYISNQFFDPNDVEVLTDIPAVLIEEQSASSELLEIGHFSREMYFVLSIQTQGRQVFSDVVKVEYPELVEIDFTATKTIHYPQKNALYLFNEQSTEFVYYDYLLNEIKNQKVLNENLSAAAVGDNGFGEEIIWGYNTAKVNVMDANTLEEKWSFYWSNSVNNIATNENGLFVLTPNFGSDPTEVFKRSDFSVSSSLTQTTDNSKKEIGFLSKTNNKLIEVGKNEANKYGLLSDGTISSWNINPSSSSNDVQDFLTISPLENYFVSADQGRLYNSAMDIEIIIENLTAKRYYEYEFSEDGQKLYCLGFQSGGYVDVINLELLEWEKRYDLDLVFPTKIFFIDGEAMVLNRVNIPSLELRQMSIHPLDFN